MNMFSGSTRATLLATSAFCAVATSALAQTSNPTAPSHLSADEYGVDMTSGTFNYVFAAPSIGPEGSGGLTHVEQWDGSGVWRNANVPVISLDYEGESPLATVSGGLVSESFAWDQANSRWTSRRGNGSTLVQNPDGSMTATNSAGDKIRFSSDSLLPEYEARANGDRTEFHYDGFWLRSITNNRGYQLRYEYAVFAGSPYLWLAKVTAINNAVDYCAPLATTCSYTRTWPSTSYAYAFPGHPSSITDQAGRATTFTYTPGGQGIASVTSPGTAVPAMAVTYVWPTETLVSTVTGARGTRTYTHGASGGKPTITATSPAGEATTVARDPSTSQVSWVRNALNQTTSLTYDSFGRLARTTLPEGNYTELAYDSRGNVNTTTRVPKAGSGLSSIVTSAVYPATCSNPVTCNQPISTTDARGGVTDYTYDASHGGVLTVTAPAPATGAPRPQTRLTYDTRYAWYKNSSGSIVQASTPIILPVDVSACITGTSCTGTANETRMTFAFGPAGVANNLLATSVSQGSGTNPTLNQTTVTYTPEGDIETVNGPVAGPNDLTHYRYNTAREVVGVIGPDPDGGGTGLNRAQRLTYNVSGQVVRAQAGTTPGYTDINWANFAPLIETEYSYDDFGRRVQAANKSAAGAVSTLAQTSYDAQGRVSCAVTRMDPNHHTIPTSACVAGPVGPAGPDRIAQIGYDALSRPLTSTTAFGQPEAITTGVTYTANGQVASFTDGNGNASLQEYDGFDRPVRLRYPNSSGGGTSTSDYQGVSYDAAGNVVSSRNRAGQSTVIVYDGLNRPIEVDEPLGTSDRAYTYDNLSRVITSSGGGQTLVNGWDVLSRLTSETSALGTMNYQYDATGAVVRVTWPDAVYVEYDRDVYGSIKTIRENGAASGPGRLAAYSHNDLGQVRLIERGNGATTTYTYDAFYRLASLSHDLAGAGGDISFGYTWNPAGQVTQRSISNPAYEHPSPSGATAYTVNGRNQVTAVGGAPVSWTSNQNAAGLPGGSYGYDSAGRLVSATVSGATAAFDYDPAGRLSASSASGRFQYVGQQRVAEYDGSGNLLKRYVPGLGLDDVTVSYTGAGTSNRSWHLVDERSSVIASSDGSGVSTTTNTYDEYGVPSSGNTGRFQYTGQIWMDEVSSYYYKSRFYAPRVGLFMQTDHIAYSGGQNVYAYVGLDPINNVDPYGLSPEEVCNRYVWDVPVLRADQLNDANYRTVCSHRSVNDNDLESENSGPDYWGVPLDPDPAPPMTGKCYLGRYEEYTVGVGVLGAIEAALGVSIELGASLPKANTILGSQVFLRISGQGGAGLGWYAGGGPQIGYGVNDGPFREGVSTSSSITSLAVAGIGPGVGSELTLEGGNGISQSVPAGRFSPGVGLWTGITKKFSLNIASGRMGC